MADMMDINIPLGQGTGIREIDRAKQQTLKLKRRPPQRRPKEKEEKKRKPADRSDDDLGNEEQPTDVDKNKVDKVSQPRGSILDVTI
jgi:hypothetical protein